MGALSKNSKIAEIVNILYKDQSDFAHWCLAEFQLLLLSELSSIVETWLYMLHISGFKYYNSCPTFTPQQFNHSCTHIVVNWSSLGSDHILIANYNTVVICSYFNTCYSSVALSLLYTLLLRVFIEQVLLTMVVFRVT